MLRHVQPLTVILLRKISHLFLGFVFEGIILCFSQPLSSPAVFNGVWQSVSLQFCQEGTEERGRWVPHWGKDRQNLAVSQRPDVSIWPGTITTTTSCGSDLLSVTPVSWARNKMVFWNICFQNIYWETALSSQIIAESCTSVCAPRLQQ